MDDRPIGFGIPKESDAIALSHAKGYLEKMRERRRICQDVNSSPGFFEATQHCFLFAQPVAYPGQLAAVRQATMTLLEGFQNPVAPLLPPAVEAAMLANLRPVRLEEAEEIVPEFVQRRHDRSGEPPDASSLGDVVAFFCGAERRADDGTTS